MINIVYAVIISAIVLFIHSQRTNRKDDVVSTFLKLLSSHASPFDFVAIVKPLGQLAVFVLAIVLFLWLL
jgi:predicted proteasome-type protease